MLRDFLFMASLGPKRVPVRQDFPGGMIVERALTSNNLCEGGMPWRLCQHLHLMRDACSMRKTQPV
jgi:hypothetical protein